MLHWAPGMIHLKLLLNAYLVWEKVDLATEKYFDSSYVRELLLSDCYAEH